MSTPKAFTLAEAARRRKLVDELGAIDVARADAIKKEIREVWMQDAKPEEALSFAGDRYVASVTARQNERSVDIRKVYKVKGIAWLLKWCSLSLKTVEEHVPLPDRGGMISDATRTGSRSVSVAALAQPAAALKQAA